MTFMFLLLPVALAVITVTAWNPLNYAFDPRIHSLGNHGPLGKIHAYIAPIFTKTIDKVVYGEDIRAKVIAMQGDGVSILDLGCGTGFSTAGTPGSIGVDLSDEMLGVATKIFPDKTFASGNAEFYETEKTYNVVTVMFLFHEVPQFSRKRIIYHAKKIASDRVVIVDIAPEYKPSTIMESGEPYIRDYLANIRDDLEGFHETVLISGHVHMWTHIV